MIEYRASAVGSGRAPAMEALEEGYEDGMDADGAIHLGFTALQAATDNKTNAAALEVAVVGVDGKFTVLSSDDVAARWKEFTA